MSFHAELTVDRADRATIDSPATLRDLSKRPIDVVVENLSASGCLFTSVRALPVGALVSIGIPGLGLRFGRISRSAPPQYGYAFLVPLDEAEIAAAGADGVVDVSFPTMPPPEEAIVLLPEPAGQAARHKPLARAVIECVAAAIFLSLLCFHAVRGVALMPAQALVRLFGWR